MKLSEAFDQVEVTPEQASALLVALVSDVRDSDFALYTSVMDAASNMTVPEARKSTTSTTSSKD